MAPCRAHTSKRCAVYRYQKNIVALKVTVLYTVGLLNTAVYRPVVLIFSKLHHGTIYFILSIVFYDMCFL